MRIKLVVGHVTKLSHAMHNIGKTEEKQKGDIQMANFNSEYYGKKYSNLSTQKQLRELYYSFLPQLKNLVEHIGDEDTADYEGPLLMHCWDDEYNNSEYKILFIGQETNGWNGFDRPKIQSDIDNILNLYITFEMGVNYNSVFWQHVNYINNVLNPGKKLNFLWSNVLKFGRSGKGRPDEIVTDAEMLYFNVLRNEIEIVKPDVVIFFSGPNYDYDLGLRIEDISFQQVDTNFEIRQLAKVQSKYLPAKSYRTYHPNYLRKSGNEGILEIIIQEAIK